MSNLGLGGFTFIGSAALSLGAYGFSDEPFNAILIAMIILVCAYLSVLPNTDYTPYERPKPKPPVINGEVLETTIEVIGVPEAPYSFPEAGKYITV